MSVAIIQERLSTYQCKTILDQENALKEIAQEIALMALFRSKFFRTAAFQGGTCLRILYNLPRFSEDLDFILEKPDKTFNWETHLKNMRNDRNCHLMTVSDKNRLILLPVPKMKWSSLQYS